MQTVTAAEIVRFSEELKTAEKSAATVEKYTRDCRQFLKILNGTPLTKEAVLKYKQHLKNELHAQKCQFKTCKYQLLVCIFGSARFKGEIPKAAAKGFLPRRKRAVARGVHAALQGGRAQTKRAAESYFANHLRHGHSGKRIEIHHRGGRAPRRGGGELQNKDALGVYCKRAKAEVAPLCEKARNSKRYDFCNQNRARHQSQQHLARDENALPRR